MDTQQEILDRLNSLTQQLQSGKLNQLEMEELVQLSREFHERCLILRYKAMEQKVYEAKGIVNEVQEVEPQKEVEAVKEEVVEETPKQEEQPEMMFDFSTPAEKEEEPAAPNFDFSSQEEETEKVEEVVESNLEPTTEAVKEEVVEETPVEEKPATPAPKKEITKVTITQPEPINTLNNPVYNQGSFYDRFNKDEDNSLASKLGATKISSLKEAFGLNDRLQAINELFEGNKDKFETTVNALDNLDSFASAKEQLSEMAVAYNWDLENEVVNDFLKKVERRYA